MESNPPPVFPLLISLASECRIVMDVSAAERVTWLSDVQNKSHYGGKGTVEAPETASMTFRSTLWEALPIHHPP